MVLLVLLLLHLHVSWGGGLNLSGHHRCLGISSRSSWMRILEGPSWTGDGGKSSIGRGEGVSRFLRNNVNALNLMLPPR